MTKHEKRSLQYRLARRFDNDPRRIMEIIREEIKKSSLTEERPEGEWKKAYLDHVAMGERPKIFYCSVCLQCIAYPTNYCPNCGADMREPKGEKGTE